MMMNKFSLGLIPLVLLGCGGAGTAGNTNSNNAGNADVALDSADTTTTESALLMTSTSAVSVSMSGSDAAAAAVVDAHVRWQPATCVQVAQSNNTVVYTLNDCTGPWGLVHVTGTVSVTFTVDASGIHAALTTNGLDVNGAVANISSTATLTINGSARTLVVATDGSGVGIFGNAITRQGSYTASWDLATECASLDGSWSTNIAGDVWSTSVSGLQKCKAQCPAQGTISHTGGLSHVTITVVFDGSDVAKWSASTGASGTVSLVCQ